MVIDFLIIIQGKMNNNIGDNQIAEKAETYIERLFMLKTQELYNGDSIRKQWYIDKDYYTREIETTILEFEYFSLHDGTHSINILNSIELLLGRDKLECLSIGDLWLLIQVAYSHDIGMVVKYCELESMWMNEKKFKDYFKDLLRGTNVENRQIAEYIEQIDRMISKTPRYNDDKDIKDYYKNNWPVVLRKYITLVSSGYLREEHGNRSRDKIDKYGKNKRIEQRLYGIVAMVDYLHTCEFDDIFEKLDYHEICFGNQEMHPRFIAALLRMGDLLDMGNNRFNDTLLEHFGKLPMISEMHLKKHKALTHFSITPKQIRATAESNEIAVCRLIASWFSWIKNENRNLIAHWNQIAPNDMGACQLSICMLKVLHNNEEFTLSDRSSYDIDKKHALSMLVGENIYESSLDFIREYVQNAIDATKVEFGKEFNNQELDYLLEDDLEDKESCMPFFFRPEAFLGFDIKVGVYIYDKETISISITDKGVGIADKDLNTLTTIGMGWKNRDDYRNRKDSKLFWLDTTGGFGIGIQSAFMISDTVEFFTKVHNTAKGHIVKLTNPRKDGDVLQQSSSSLSEGTMVKINVPLNIFMKEEIYNQKSPNTIINKTNQLEFKNYDYFSNDEIVNNILDGVEFFLNHQIINSVFPITIINDIRIRRELYSDFWYVKSLDNHKNGKYIFREFNRISETSNDYYNIDSDFTSIRYISSEMKCLISMDFSVEKKGEFVYCYKGIAITQEFEEEYFFNGMLDIMQKDVAQYLKVNRREFAKNYSKNVVKKDMIVACLKAYIFNLREYIISHDKFLPQFKHNVLNNIIKSIIKWLPNDEDAKYLFNLLTIGNREFFLKTDTVYLNKIYIRNDHIITRNKNIFIEGLCLMLINLIYNSKHIYVELNSSIAQADKSSAIYIKYNMYDESNHEDDNIIDSVEIAKIHRTILNDIEDKQPYIDCENNKTSHIIEELDNILGDNYCTVCISKGMYRVYGVKISEKIQIKNSIDFTLITQSDHRAIIKNPDGYDKLHVNSLPFTKKEITEDAMGYLIMPVGTLISNKIEKALTMNYSFDKFFNNTIKDNSDLENKNNDENEDVCKEWCRLIEWTYEHQCNKGKYSKTEINDEYKRLLKNYYSFLKRQHNVTDTKPH